MASLRPPSPGNLPAPRRAASSPSRTSKMFKRTRSPLHGRIAKPQRKQRKVLKVDREVAASTAAAVPERSAVDSPAVKSQVFRFLDLPGELRNRIYGFATSHDNQALLKHAPRRASLRPRSSKNVKPSQRPFFGLTQVCRQLRAEFRPLYLLTQEIGLDLTQTNEYVLAFYSAFSPELLYKTAMGNITVAISDKVSKAEMRGVNVWPMLEIWANSYRIEAGFGRYSYKFYDPGRDGEAKDLYRLFGRYVLPDRKCSRMNHAWRNALRDKKLAAVRVFRKSAGPVRPFLHITFKPEFAEAWMTQEDSTAKMPGDWLWMHGFDNLEHFQVKVGVATSVK